MVQVKKWSETIHSLIDVRTYIKNVRLKNIIEITLMNSISFLVWEGNWDANTIFKSSHAVSKSMFFCMSFNQGENEYIYI